MTDISLHTPEGILALLSVRGVGPKTVEPLLRKYETLDEVGPGLRRGAVPGVSARAALSLREPDALQRGLSSARDLLDRSADLGIRAITFLQPEYPELLGRLADKPLVIWAKGELPPPKAVACIGTREPSEFGVEVTRRITGLLASNGWTIVSGLALGVDTLAHEAALEVGGKTIAVLANGLDKVYPARNRELAAEILKEGGGLFSEQPLGVPAVARNLVARDRLQSGASQGTVVMQTGVKGGSMHTVRFTLEQRRLLFAPVPRKRHAQEEKSQGTLLLTQELGPKVARTLGADGEYARLLRSSFRQRPPAEGIESRADYDRLLVALEAQIERKPGPARPPAQPALFPS